jgi:hypothetical protein
MAELTARSLRVPAFAGDWLMGALAPSGVLDGLDRPSFLALYYRLLRMLVTRPLMLGQSAVLDCLVDDSFLGDLRELTGEFGARLFVVEFGLVGGSGSAEAVAPRRVVRSHPRGRGPGRSDPLIEGQRALRAGWALK